MVNELLNLPIPKHGEFCDLNVTLDNNTFNNKCKCEMLINLGYNVIALNRYVGKPEATGKKSKNVIPEPYPDFIFDDEIEKQLKAENRRILQLKRITLELHEMSDLSKVRDVIQGRKYDIIAVKPMNEKLFHAASQAINIDIICMEGSEKLPYLPRKTDVACAISRGICFEFLYSPMLRDDESMQRTIMNAKSLCQWAKGKNLILSGGALIAMESRSPNDVANISTLFGVAKSQAIHCVQKNSRIAIVHGFQRKTAKSAVYAQYSPNVQNKHKNEDESLEDQPDLKRQKVD